MMHINDLEGKEIGEFFNDIHKKFYGYSVEKSDLFRGSNVGNTILGLAIVEASNNIKEGLIEFAKIIKEKD